MIDENCRESWTSKSLHWKEDDWRELSRMLDLKIFTLERWWLRRIVKNVGRICRCSRHRPACMPWAKVPLPSSAGCYSLENDVVVIGVVMMIRMMKVFIRSEDRETLRLLAPLHHRWFLDALLTLLILHITHISPIQHPYITFSWLYWSDIPPKGRLCWQQLLSAHSWKPWKADALSPLQSTARFLFWCFDTLTINY